MVASYMENFINNVLSGTGVYVQEVINTFSRFTHESESSEHNNCSSASIHSCFTFSVNL